MILYDELVMDHIKNSRNYREIVNADHTEIGANPLCGDELTLFAHINDRNIITDIAYQCSCCGIAMASASLMTEHVKGRPISEVIAMTKLFANDYDHGKQTDESPDLAVRTMLGVARHYPARRLCSSLPWKTLDALLGKIFPEDTRP